MVAYSCNKERKKGQGHLANPSPWSIEEIIHSIYFNFRAIVRLLKDNDIFLMIINKVQM